MVSGQKWLGGLTIHTARLCRELERLGHQVAVVSIGVDAVVDLFPHARTHYGSAPGPPLHDVPSDGASGHGAHSSLGHPPAGRVSAVPDGDYVFRYEVVADAAGYLPPGPPGVRRALAPLARLGMGMVVPTGDLSRAPLRRARGVGAALARGLAAALDAGLSGEAAEAPFLTRLLLHTDEADVRRLGEIRAWFNPDVEYACDLSLVPLMARVEDRSIPLVAAAQGFEIVQRRGVGLMAGLHAARPRLDLVLSGSRANVDENLRQFPLFQEGSPPVRVVPYGVALDEGWELSREAALARVRDLEPHLTPEQRGAGGLWGPADSPTPFIVTAFSRIDVEKGSDLALHALAILRRRGVPARLWIAGNAMPGSAYLDVLRQKIRLLDLGHCVSLIGTLRDQQDKIALLRASDAFLAGFIRSEPFGLVLTEAFATELAVVAPATGAAPELMEYVGDTSTLYPPNDTGAMADRLQALYEDPAHRAGLAARQRHAYLTHFNATEMASATAAAFEWAIRERAGRPHA